MEIILGIWKPNFERSVTGKEKSWKNLVCISVINWHFRNSAEAAHEELNEAGQIEVRRFWMNPGGKCEWSLV